MTHADQRCRLALRLSILLSGLWLAGLPGAAAAISVGPFGPGGLGGSSNGQSATFGGEGQVFELDAFLYTGAGPAVSLSTLGGGAGGLAISFGASISADGSDLLLTYELTNTDLVPLAGFTFLSFVDAEIAEPTTTYFNEVASVLGTPAVGQGFEIDEPGYAFGDILDNVAAGALDGRNAVGPGAADDVSMALSFQIGSLDPGDLARIQIQLSEDGDALGPLRLVQSDPLALATTLTYSGQSQVVRAAAPIPEPGGALLFLVGGTLLFRRNRNPRTGDGR